MYGDIHRVVLCWACVVLAVSSRPLSSLKCWISVRVSFCWAGFRFPPTLTTLPVPFVEKLPKKRCWSSAQGDLVPQIARYDQGRLLVLPNCLCYGISSQLCVTDLWRLISCPLGLVPSLICAAHFETLHLTLSIFFKSRVNSNEKPLHLYQENWQEL